eukprot:4498348-Ditylum_brightwellii.AAC.1
MLKKTRKSLEFSRSVIIITASKKLTPVTDVTKAAFGLYLQCTIPPIQKIKLRNGQTTLTTFRAYIQMLPRWEKILLDRLQSMGLHSLTLKQLLQMSEEIWVVTDGGVNQQLGYFGFVIATSTQILWKGDGQAQGNAIQMESLHTKKCRRFSSSEIVDQIYCLPFNHTKNR